MNFLRKGLCMGERTLEEKTQAYWNISQAYNSPKPTLTVERAIRDLGDIEDETSSQKLLAIHATKMLDSIIGFPEPETDVDLVITCNGGPESYECGQDNYTFDPDFAA